MEVCDRGLWSIRIIARSSSVSGTVRRRGSDWTAVFRLQREPHRTNLNQAVFIMAATKWDEKASAISELPNRSLVRYSIEFTALPAFTFSSIEANNWGLHNSEVLSGKAHPRSLTFQQKIEALLVVEQLRLRL